MKETGQKVFPSHQKHGDGPFLLKGKGVIALHKDVLLRLGGTHLRVHSPQEEDHLIPGEDRDQIHHADLALLYCVEYVLPICVDHDLLDVAGHPLFTDAADHPHLLEAIDHPIDAGDHPHLFVIADHPHLFGVADHAPLSDDVCHLFYGVAGPPHPHVADHPHLFEHLIGDLHGTGMHLQCNDVHQFVVAGGHHLFDVGLLHLMTEVLHLLFSVIPLHQLGEQQSSRDLLCNLPKKE